MRQKYGLILTVLAVITFLSIVPSSTLASYGDDIQFTNNTDQEVVVSITGAYSYFLWRSSEWEELGIEKEGFYKYPNEEIRLAKGESSRWLKQWRIKHVAVRYAGYVGGKSLLWGYSVNDNYIDFDGIWNTKGNASVSIKESPPSSSFGYYTGISMTLNFETTYANRSDRPGSKSSGPSSSQSSTNDSNASGPNRSASEETHIPEELKHIYTALGITSKRPTPYQILGVEEDATPQEIKKAYRQLTIKYHPDKNVNKSASEKELAENVFKVVNNAYDALS